MSDSESDTKSPPDSETEDTPGVDMKMADARLSQLRRAQDKRGGQSKLKSKYKVVRISI